MSLEPLETSVRKAKYAHQQAFTIISHELTETLSHLERLRESVSAQLDDSASWNRLRQLEKSKDEMKSGLIALEQSLNQVEEVADSMIEEPLDRSFCRELDKDLLNTFLSHDMHRAGRFDLAHQFSTDAVIDEAEGAEAMRTFWKIKRGLDVMDMTAAKQWVADPDTNVRERNRIKWLIHRDEFLHLLALEGAAVAQEYSRGSFADFLTGKYSFEGSDEELRRMNVMIYEQLWRDAYIRCVYIPRLQKEAVLSGVARTTDDLDRILIEHMERISDKGVGGINHAKSSHILDDDNDTEMNDESDNKETVEYEDKRWGLRATQNALEKEYYQSQLPMNSDLLQNVWVELEQSIFVEICIAHGFLYDDPNPTLLSFSVIYDRARQALKKGIGNWESLDGIEKLVAGNDANLESERLVLEDYDPYRYIPHSTFVCPNFKEVRNDPQRILACGHVVSSQYFLDLKTQQESANRYRGRERTHITCPLLCKVDPEKAPYVYFEHELGYGS